MQGKTVVITGATSGIGEVAAVTLARQGAKVLFVARDKARGEATLAKLRAAGPNQQHAVFYGDLMRLSEMKRLGAEIAATAPSIDVLINNAGAMFPSRDISPDGLERTFALNHMAYFVLTNALLDKLAQNARVVSTASTAHYGAQLDFDDLQMEKKFDFFAAYGRSKLCNILFTRTLAKKLAGRATANCLHPGFVATRIGSGYNPLLDVVATVAKVFALSPERGADTIIWLASSPDAAQYNGLYFDRRKSTATSPEAQSDADAERLWAASEAIARAA
jgi:NAD(P)-dependent dehydrogenase (short-subunit alcohol dehydrogenase family)